MPLATSDNWYRVRARDKYNRRDAYKSEPISIGVVLEVIWQVPAGHPVRNEL